MSWLRRLLRRPIRTYSVKIFYCRMGIDEPKVYNLVIDEISAINAAYACAEMWGIDTENVSFHNLGERKGIHQFILIQL